MKRLFNNISVCLLAALAPVVPVLAQETGTVYVMTNDPNENEIVLFRRAANGRLNEQGRVATGGRGTGGNIDPLTSQGALILSRDESELYAVNAGSRQITRFRVEGDDLERLAVFSSRGALPVSLTQHDDLLYVLNASNRPHIFGFRLEEDGSVRRLGRSRRFLGSDVAPNGRADQPIQVSFTPDGNWLVLTDAMTDELHIFAVAEDGRPSQTATRWPSVGGGPFGFGFDPRGHLLVSELWGRNPSDTQLDGAVSSYEIFEDGTLELISRSIENNELATCWLVSDGRRSAFTTNTTSGTISRYRVRNNGTLVRKGGPVRFPGPRDTFPTDMAVTSDGRFLYTLNGGRGTVGMFRVRKSGRLVLLGEAGSLPPSSGLQGIAAR